jgi:DNA-directed RNA polymerase subunit RPC12/RpoP
MPFCKCYACKVSFQVENIDTSTLAECPYCKQELNLYKCFSCMKVSAINVDDPPDKCPHCFTLLRSAPIVNPNFLQDIFFRGDKREKKEVFTKGFESKKMTVDIEYRRFGTTVGDVEPDSAVCFSQTLEAAAVFPLKMLSRQEFDKILNIYVFSYPRSEIFNTFEKQKEAAAEIIQDKAKEANSIKKSSLDLFGMLCAREAAVKKVPAKYVLAVVHIERTIPKNWKSGGELTIIDHEMSKFYLPSLKKYVSQVDKYFNFIKGTTHRVPGQKEGVDIAKQLSPKAWPFKKKKKES